MGSLLRHEIKKKIVAIVGWGIGLVAFGAIYIGVYPQMAEQMAELAQLPMYEALGVSLGTFRGYLASTVFGFLPLLLGIYTIGVSTETLAGEEGAGTLELILAMPLTRWKILSAKAAAIGVATAGIILIAAAGNALVLHATGQAVEIDVGPMTYFSVVLSTWPITIAFSMFALFVGTVVPSRRIAVVSVTVLFVASYFWENVCGMVESLESLKWISLFSYLDSTAEVFVRGVRPADVAVLLGATALFYLLALFFFARRNITTGAWPWQQPRLPASDRA